MNHSNDSEKTKVADKPKAESKIAKYVLAFIRDALAILFWAYVVTKVFVFDIDIFLIEKFSPNYAWILNYKFFILIGLISVAWLVTKNKHILLWALYVLFYPVIVFLWKIPFFVFKQKSWVLAFAIIDAIIFLFKSIKFSFITTSLFLISTALILGSSNRALLWTSIVVLTVILFAVYIQRLILVFRSSGVYQIYTKFFSGLGKFIYTSPVYAVDANIAVMPLESMDNKQIEKWTTSVQTFVLYNRVCIFVSKKLKSYQASGFNVVSSVMTILLLIVFTVLSFSIINFGLFKINQDYYSFSAIPTFFNFFYYSFNVLLFNSIQDVAATTPLSQIMIMIEEFFALFLVAIFVSLMFSFRSQKDSEELNQVIKDLGKEGEKFEGYIRENYNLNNIEDAMIALRKLQSVFTDLLYKMTESIG